VLYYENRQCESSGTFHLDHRSSLEICSKLPTNSRKQEGVQQMLLPTSHDHYSHQQHHSHRHNNNNNITSGKQRKGNVSLSKVVHNKIGYGITLMVDANRDIWLYNRSQIQIFVCSVTAVNSTTGSVTKIDPDSLRIPFKVFPGHMVKVFDSRVYDKLSGELKSLPVEVKEKLSSLLLTHFEKGCFFKFSFGRGFGPAYGSRDILECPCWVQFDRMDERR